MYVNASDVNVRESPGLKSNILEILQKGEKLRIIDVKGDWYYIEYRGGKKGWIFKQYIISTQPVISATPTPLSTPPPSGRIVFATDKGLRIINSDGSNLKSLTDRDGDDYPVWSPDGSKISFVNYRDGRALYIINSDGTGRKRLLNKFSVTGYPSWSIDGLALFFAVEFQENFYGTFIFMTNLKSGEVKNIIQNERTINEFPKMSGDGKFIAFNSRRDKNGEIYIMKPDGSEQRNITDNPAEELLAEWSYDSKNILFTSDRNSNYKEMKTITPPRDIYLLNINSQELRNISNHSADDYNPVFSNDGTKIAFVSNRDEDKTLAGLFVIKSTGEKNLRIATERGCISNISWSIDSANLVFHLFNNGKNSLYVVKPDGTKFYLAEGFSPVWCPVK